jgi:hypothetical protein
MKEFIIKDGDHPKVTGTRTLYKFPNGYGANVISGELFYTNDTHPYELAVVRFTSEGGEYEIDYSTPITNDVVPYLDEQGLHDTLVQIKALDPIVNENKGE